MSIQPEIGAKLVMAAGENHPVRKVKECERFLDSLLTVLRRKSVDENEELVLAALVALNNLSYYADMSNADSAGPFGARQLDITQGTDDKKIDMSIPDCSIKIECRFSVEFVAHHSKSFV